MLEPHFKAATHPTMPVTSGMMRRWTSIVIPSDWQTWWPDRPSHPAPDIDGEQWAAPAPAATTAVATTAAALKLQGSQSARKIRLKPEFRPFAQNDPNNTWNFAFWPEKLKFSETLAEKVLIWPKIDPNFNLRLCEEKIIIYKQHFILLQIVSKQFNIIFYFSL